MPRTPEKTRALFDRWAETYDEAATGAARDSTDPLAGYLESLDEAASLVPLSEGMQVLDIGIGTGAFASLLAQRGGRVSGVDPSPKMLALCRASHPEFVLAEGSFLEIPFANCHFDTVISSFAFHEVAPGEREAACREAARVVKPGGYLCLLDIMFVSIASREAARLAIGARWDGDEDYPLVGDLDIALRSVGFTNAFWRQTAPCHWLVLARRGS